MQENPGTFIEKEDKEFSRFYKFSFWYVTNRERLKQIGLGLFVAFDAILLLFVLWVFLDSFVISYDRERLAVAEIVAYGQGDLHAYTQANAAISLDSSSVTVFSLGNGQYDLYAELENPNQDWWAEFTYRFVGTGEEEPTIATGFILPAETKPIVNLGLEAVTRPNSAKLEIMEVDWHHVDRHVVGNYEEWFLDRFQIEVENENWSVDRELEDPIGKISFSARNGSAYSYYDPVFYVLLKRGNRVLGVTRTELASLDSFDSEDIEISWFDDIPSVGSVEVIPEINIFDIDVYKALEGENSLDTRTRVFPRRR